MRLHNVRNIRKKIVTSTLDEFSGNSTPSPSSVRIPNPDVDISIKGDHVLLHYNYPICPSCFSRKISKNGTYMREISGKNVMIQKYVCKECSYSFEARPPDTESTYPKTLKRRV